MNRGSLASDHAKELLRWASMRPRFMNRGSAGGRWLRVRLRLRFNEAPIHESGKSSDGDSHEDNHQSFNEAPIHESGKSSAANKVTASCVMLQ